MLTGSENHGQSNVLHVDVHGVVARASLPPEDEMLRPLLEFFPTSHVDPTLRLTLSTVDDPIENPFDSRWTKAFFFGLLQGFLRADGGAYGLSDEYSRGTFDRFTGSLSFEMFRRNDGCSAFTTSGLLHALFCLALREHGLFELHAGGVCDANDSARLLVGNSDSGKTSLTLAMIAAGCQFLGDDRVLLQRTDDETSPVALCAYPRTFHVAAATAAAFPSLQSLIRVADGLGGKYALAPHVAFAQAFHARWQGPTSILLPCVANAPHTTVRPVAPADILGALLESSALAIVEGIHHRDANLALLTTLANTARGFRVFLGRDALEQPEATARRILAASRPAH